MLLVSSNINANGLSREDNFSPKAFHAAHAQCWCGLGSAHAQASTSASASSTTRSNRVITTQLDFPWDDELEPDATGPHKSQHELRLIISGYRWEAHSNMGTFQHEARDLDEKDIAPFALLDTLTRWLLPHWRGGILHVRTNDVCVLRGIQGGDCGSYSGVWNAVQSLCGQYDVRLSANVVEQLSLSSPGTFYAHVRNTRDDRRGAGTVLRALRNPDVVNAAVKWLMGSGQEGSIVSQAMLSHLGV